MAINRKWRLAVLLIGLVAGRLSAQDAKQPPPAQPDTPTKPDADPDSAAAREAAAKSIERLIYIPYRNLKSVFDKHGATVFLPYLEYLRLWERSIGSAEASKTAPVDGVITEAAYTARIDENLVRITARLTVQVLGKPWAEVPVGFGQAAIGRIDAGEGQVLLRGTGPGTYSLLFPEPGTHQVTIELSTRIRTSAVGNSFELACPTVGMTTFELVIPTPAQAVELTPQLVSLPVEAGEDETRVRARLGSTPKISVLWYPRAGLKPDMDLLTSVVNYQQVTIADELVHTDAFLHYEVLRGDLTELRIAVPVGHRILDVTSSAAKIKGWRAVAEQNRQVVRVEFLGQVEKKFVLEVHTEHRAPPAGESFAVSGVDPAGIDKSGIDDPGMKVHGIHSLDAVRESGQVALSHGRDLSLTVQPPSGLVRIDQAEVFKAIRRAGAKSYKFYSPRFDLQVAYEPVQPRVTVDHASQLVFDEDELRLTAKLKYTVERAGVFEWTLRLPENVELDDVVGDARKEHSFDAATRLLTVSLNERRQGTLNLTVTAHRKLDADTPAQDLPILEPLKVIREAGRVHVYALEAIEVTTDEEQLAGVQPDRAGQAPPKVGVARLASAWNYTVYPDPDTGRSVRIPITTSRKPTRVSASVATAVNARQQLVEVVSHVVFTVEYAGKDTFRFQVPESLKGVQIESVAPPSSSGSGRLLAPVGIKQKQEAEPEDGLVTWTIVMQRKVTGRQAFEVSYNLTLEEDDSGGKVTIDPPRPLDLDNENIQGEIVVIKDESLEVTTEPGSEDLEPIDIRELRQLPSSGAAAYRYFRQPVQLVVTTKKYETERVIETVVSQALVEVVMSEDGQVSYRCRYRMKSSERQRLRVDLPQDVELIAVYVDVRKVAHERPDLAGQAAPRKGWQAYAINVTRTSQSDQAFFVTLHFQNKDDELFGAWLGKNVAIDLPAIGGSKGPTGVAVQALRTAIWVPDDYALIGTPDSFVYRRVRGDVDSWLEGHQQLRGLGSFPTQGRRYVYNNLGGTPGIGITWWRTWSMTSVISLTVFVVGCVLMRTTWSNRVGFLLVTGFIVTLCSLAAADVVTHSLVAARWGMFFTGTAWLLAAVLGVKLSRPSSDGPDTGGDDDARPPVFAADEDSVEADDEDAGDRGPGDKDDADEPPAATDDTAGDDAGPDDDGGDEPAGEAGADAGDRDEQDNDDDDSMRGEDKAG